MQPTYPALPKMPDDHNYDHAARMQSIMRNYSLPVGFLSISIIILKTLFNIAEDRFKKKFELWCLCFIMMFRRANKQPGMQQF